MILTEQVSNFVCKHMSEKAVRAQCKLLSTFYDPEVKHVFYRASGHCSLLMPDVLHHQLATFP